MLGHDRSSDRMISVEYDQDMLDLSSAECALFLGEVNMHAMRLEVFNLFEIDPGMDADLSLHKVQVLEDADE